MNRGRLVRILAAVGAAALVWLASDAAPALISGLIIIGLAAGAIGYLLAIFVWRWWTGRKWRRRALRGIQPPID